MKIHCRPLTALALTSSVSLGACAPSPIAPSADPPPPSPAHAADGPRSRSAPPAEPATVAARSSAAPSAEPQAAVAPAKAEPIAGEPLGSPVSNAPTTSSQSVPDADKVVVALRPKFKACYAAAHGSGSADIVGMVSSTLHITKQGKVASISVVRRDRLPYPLVDCIVRELRAATFGPLEEEAVINVPVRFAAPGQD